MVLDVVHVSDMAPTTFKNAVLKPVTEETSPGCINHYQPVSNLPFKLEVSESINLVRTVEHMLAC